MSRAKSRKLAQAIVLVSLATFASGIGGNMAPHERLRSWYVVHGSPQHEVSLHPAVPIQLVRWRNTFQEFGSQNWFRCSTLLPIKVFTCMHACILASSNLRSHVSVELTP